MEILKKTYQFFFFLGVFFLPFNSDIPKWLGVLGEFSEDSSPLFFLISIFFLGIAFLAGKKIYFPFKSRPVLALLAFTFFLIFCTLVNFPTVLENYFKGISGINRFFRQFLAFFIIGYLMFSLYLNIANDMGSERFFLKVRKVFFWSLLIVFPVGILEFMVLKLNIGAVKPILNLADLLPFVKIKLDYNLRRVGSITYEPPALGTYLITIFGFMFSYILTSTKKYFKYIPVAAVIFLGLISGSRTAFVVLGFQMMVGFYFSFLHFQKFRKFAVRALFAGLIALVIGFSFFSKTIISSVEKRMESLNVTELTFSQKNNSISNKSRLGIQYALVETYKKHPVFGTGFGQQAYHSRYEYPYWATRNNWEFKAYYLNENLSSFPPGYNLYLRVLAETGIVGFIAFLVFLGTVIREMIVGFHKDRVKRYISIALIISILGFLFNWLQIDSFRLYGFWLSLAILIVLNKENAS